ncbi:MAG: PspC domain-containing protein [Chloroflexi bacterium]|jgi:phage shock protein C|nr:PspC domain-containing protein [Anaerolineaceae bacterium]NMB90434.1 PspC domain-containing protein [Chloroflexota bacterium]
MERKLYRSRKNYMVGGVCGGLGEYLNIDPNLVRIFFVLLMLEGIGVAVYFILWIIIPREDEVIGPEGSQFHPSDLGERARQMGQEVGQAFRQPQPNTAMWAGIALILAGIFFLLRSLPFPWLNWLDRDLLWPLLLIVGGGALLLRAIQWRE